MKYLRCQCKTLSLVLVSMSMGVFLTLGFITYDKSSHVTWLVNELKARGVDAMRVQTDVRLESPSIDDSEQNLQNPQDEPRPNRPSADNPQQNLQNTQDKPRPDPPSPDNAQVNLENPQDNSEQEVPKLISDTSKKIVYSNKKAVRVINARKKLLHDTCLQKPELTDAFNGRQAMFNHKYSLYYCPVEKTASTFWRRFFYQLEWTNPVKSPFDVAIQTAFNGSSRFKVRFEDKRELQKVVDSATTILFVRDPYSRLFSAFVDKLLPPNPVYWKAWGRPAIVNFRKREVQGLLQDEKAEPCGDDVTFREFVREAVSHAWRTDPHLTPIVHLCTPCSVLYDIVGKMESFVDDATVVVETMGIKPSQLRFEAMNDDATADAIEDSSTDALSASWLRSTLKCASMESVARRIWRKLQLRGFISWRRRFPLSPEQCNNLKSPELIRILKKDSQLDVNHNELKLQKKQGMLEAFASLAPSDLIEIKKVFEMDFKLFGFNVTTYDSVGALGDTVKDTHAFDWRKDWDLSPIL